MVVLLELSLRVRMVIDKGARYEKATGFWSRLSATQSPPMLPFLQSRTVIHPEYLLFRREMLHDLHMVNHGFDIAVGYCLPL